MKNRARIIIIVLFLLLTGIFFRQALTGKRIFATGDILSSDIMDFNYPVRNYLGESLRSGKLPLWNPYIFSGFPSHAEGQGGFCYPLNWLFVVLPGPLAYNYCVIINFLLAGFFMYRFARSLKLGEWGAAACAFVFAFSGFFVGHLKHMNMINAAAWTPALFYCAGAFFRKQNIKYVVLSGVVMAMQVFAGHMQVMYYSLLGAAIYALYLYWQNVRVDKGVGKLKFKRVISLIVLAGVITLGLSAVQLLPTMEMKPLSTRSIGVLYDEAVWKPYKLLDLVMFVSPYYFGDPAKANFNGADRIFWENCAYAGILPLLLLLVALFMLFRKNRNVRFFFVLMVLALILAMPGTFPVFKLFWYIVPGFKMFRFPQRLLLLAGFSIAILSGFGLDYILKKYSKGYIVGIVAGALIVIDLFRFGAGHNPVVAAGEWFSEPETVSFVKKDDSEYRVYSLWYNFRGLSTWSMIYNKAGGWKGDMSPYFRHRNVLQENSNMLHGIKSAGGYSSFYLRRYYNLENTLASRMSFNDQSWDAGFPKSVTKVLGMFNVKYLLSVWNLKGEMLSEVMRARLHKGFPHVKVFENKAHMPRAYIVGRSIPVLKDDAVIDIMLHDKFNPAEAVIVEENILHGSRLVKGASADIIKSEPMEVVVDAKLKSAGFLVLTDTYYPGWKAYVDGRETKILRANYLYRAVPLAKGNHTVAFKYRPRPFYAGLIISVLTILLLFITRSRWLSGIKGRVK